MTDNIHITGVEFNTSNLPTWATELSQKQILDTLQKHFKTDHKKQDELKKAMTDYNKSNKKAIKSASQRQGQEAKSLNKLLETLTKTTREGLDNVIKVQKKKDSPLSETKNKNKNKIKPPPDFASQIKSDLSNLFEDMSPTKYLPKKGILSKFNSSIKTATGNLGMLQAATIGVISTLTGAVVGSIRNQMDAYQSVYDAGVLLSTEIGGSVVGSLGAMSVGANLANVSLAEMANVTSTYGRVMETVGIQKFGKMSSEFNKNMAGFGVTTAESAEYLADYLDIQRKAGLLDQLDKAQAGRAAEEAFKTTVAFSQALKMSRKEIDDANRKMADDVSAQSVIASAPKHLQAAVQKSLSVLAKGIGAAAPELQQTLLNVAKLPAEAMERSPEIQALRKSGLGGVAEEVMRSAKQMQKGAFSEKGVKRLQTTFANITTAQYNHVQKLDAFGYDFAGVTTGLLYESRAMNMRLAEQGKKTKAEMAKEDALAKARSHMSSAMSKFSNLWDNIIGKMFGSPEVMDAFSTTMKSFTKWIDESGDTFKDIGMSLATEVLPVVKEFAIWIASLFEKDESGKMSFNLGGMISDMAVTMATSVGGLITAALLLPGTFTIFAKTVGAGLSAAGTAIAPMLKKGVWYLLKRIPLLGGILEGGYGFVKSLMDGNGIMTSLGKGFKGFAQGIIDSFLLLPALLTDWVVKGLFDVDLNLASLTHNVISTMQGWVTDFFELIDPLNWLSDNRSESQKNSDRIKELKEKDPYDSSSTIGWGERSQEEELELSKLSRSSKTREARQPRNKIITPSEANAQAATNAKTTATSPDNSVTSPQSPSPQINTHIMERLIAVSEQLLVETQKQTKLQEATKRNTKNGNLNYPQ